MRTFTIFIVLAVAASVCDAQWVQTGPYGGDVSCFAISGTNLFAGTDGEGVILSTNDGASWTAVNSGLH